MAGTAVFNLPVITLSSQSGVQAARSAFPLPILSLVASGITGGAATSAFSLPAITVQISAQQNGLGQAAIALPIVTLAAAGSVGNVGTAAFALPIITLAASGRYDIIGTATFGLPLIYLQAAAGRPSSSYRTWALNLHRNALTEYTNFDFNSYAVFNNQVLACSPAGVVVLGTQALDGAIKIDATAMTGLSDFDFSQHSRVPRLYLDSSQNGDLHFKAITREGGTRTYLLPWNRLSSPTQRRVPIGKGPRSRFWQFGVENVEGADFQITSIMAYPTKLRRRVS